MSIENKTPNGSSLRCHENKISHSHWTKRKMGQILQFNIQVGCTLYIYETFQKMLLIDWGTLHFRLRLAIFSYLLNRSLSSSFSCRADSNSFLKSKKKVGLE